MKSAAKKKAGSEFMPTGYDSAQYLRATSTDSGGFGDWQTCGCAERDTHRSPSRRHGKPAEDFYGRGRAALTAIGSGLWLE